MFFYSPGKDKDIVQVDNYNIFYYEILKDVVYHYLECDWTISHAEKHYQ